MILDGLVQQLVQRFQYERRAQVCLWFDERKEFTRLLPALRAHLGARITPPFRLLEYDAAQHQGQIWLRHEMQRALDAADPETRKNLRFVLYLPFSEDRLSESGPNGEPPLDLLTEYKLAGITWRIGGKRPTLFSFLRQIDVALPENPADQRRLYEGGSDSLLAKYVSRHADRPDVFWRTTLTPELAQSRLLGDVDQILLDLAVDPETGWKRLVEQGLDRELLDLIRERYGFPAPATALSDWMREMVSMLALTETYLAYEEPADFPFADRLPPLPLRQHHVQLLQRWLRDAESRPAWDHWIQVVEARIDLTTWAAGRSGFSFGFPHLVRQRWQAVRGTFEDAASRASTTSQFFEQHRNLIAKEAEYSKASSAPIGAWALLKDLDAFLRSCVGARSNAESLDSAAELARLYIASVASVERQHLRIRQAAEEHGLPSAARVADRAYASYANALNSRFFERLMKSGAAKIPGVPGVTPHLERHLWETTGRRAVLIVDALRYDCALAIQELLREQEVGIEPMVAMLPTVTAVGMTALLPISRATVTVTLKDNGIHPLVDGKDTFVRANRIAYLRSRGATCLNIEELEGSSSIPAGLNDLLAVFGHDEVDHIGHGEAQTLVRHLQIEIERLARLIRKLHHWGYPHVHVVTDHGFILLDEERLPDEVPCDKDWCVLRKERFALVRAGADVPLATFPFPWDQDLRVALPPGLAFFKAEKSFSHGGAALQEMIIPHLLSKSRAALESPIGVEIVLPSNELTTLSLKVTLRPRQADAPETKSGQLGLSVQKGRTLVLDVLRTLPSGRRSSVIANGPKEVRIEPGGSGQSVTLFLHSAADFQKGEFLDLDIRDLETGEQLPPGGIKLTAGRDM